MNKLETIKNDMGVLYSKVIKERINISNQEDGNYNTYRKLIDIMFKTFDTYSKLNRHYSEENSNSIRIYYNFINAEADEITKLLDSCSLEQYRCLIDIRNRIFEKSTDLETWYDVGNTVKCNACENVFPESRLNSKFYLSNSTDTGRMNICKDCANELYKDDIEGLCKDNDLYYNEILWKSMQDKKNPVGSYLKDIFGLPQYKRLRWKDSVFVGNVDELKKLNNKDKKLMYVDYIYIEKDYSDKVLIYFEDNIHIIKSNDKIKFKMSDYAKLIYDMINVDEVIIYVDTHGFGISLYDALNQYRGLDVRELKVKNLEVK